MHRQHRDRDEPGQQREWAEQTEEAAVVGHAQRVVEANGAPTSALPTATPKMSAGTKPPTNSAYPRTPASVALATLLRYLKPTGRRMSAQSTTNMAR